MAFWKRDDNPFNPNFWYDKEYFIIGSIILALVVYYCIKGEII